MPLTELGVESTLEHGHDEFRYLAVGTGTPTANGCGAEIARVLIATKRVSGRVRQFEALFTNSEGVGDITEWAIHKSAAGTDCLVYKALDEALPHTSAKPLLVSVSEPWNDA